MKKFFNIPFSTAQNLKNCEETVRRLCALHNVAIPENPHFITHLEECNPVAIQDAFRQWDGTAGAHTFEVTSGTAVTRLTGKAVKGVSVKGEERTMISRGAGREPQPVIIREMPFQDTDLFTLIIFPNDEGQLTLWTAHSGPSMPPNFNAPEWEHSALAYKASEV